MSGMDVDEDGDSFFEDDFPDIEEHVLQQLEQNAITHTYQEHVLPRNSEQPHPKEKNDLNPRHTATASLAYGSTAATTASALPGVNETRLRRATVDSFDGGLDENGVPLVVEETMPPVVQRRPDEMAMREQWRKKRFGPSNPAQQASPRQSFTRQNIGQQQPPTRFQAYPGVSRQQPSMLYDDFSPMTSATFEDDSPQLKIEDLTAQLARVNEELLARKGEIQIIRAKHAEEDKIHSRELDVLRKIKHEEAEKHRLMIEALRGEQAKTISDMQFMKQELSEESRLVQSLKHQLKELPLRDKPTNITSTPQRNASSLRDGFDDEDLMIISPVKAGKRSNKGTPTANRKRKQPAAGDLNVPPLDLKRVQGSGDETQQLGVAPTKPVYDVTKVKQDKVTERHLRLVQRVLAFCPFGSRESVTERLMKLSFPSDHTRSLGSIVLSATAKLQGKRLPADLLQIFIDLWSRALREKFHACLHLLIAVTNFILDLDCCVVDQDIISNLLPVAQLTAEINATARFRLLVNKDWLDNPEKKKPTFDDAVNTTVCLDLLYSIASLASDEAELISHFWRSMTTDFVLMMLNACQPAEDVTLMLQLLGTSILPTTFGNVCTTGEQSKMESYITDRICYLLWDVLKTLETEKPCPKAVICKLRLEAIDLLTKLTMTSSLNPFDPTVATNHGTVFLANHSTAIPRLVRSIYEETYAMYLVTPTQSLHADLVNNAIHVLHFILNSPAGKEIDLQRKLAGTNGAAQKCRVVLTRLAFSEGQFIDRGITDETVRLATGLLEDSITPDEADDFMAAFGGSTGRSFGT